MMFPERNWNRVRKTAALAAAGLALLLILPAYARTDLASSKHDLTPDGPGPVRETATSGLCVFCHTPHNAATTRALWNRDMPSVTYNLYQSSTLQASPGQPTGSSRLCLSCHDGILALGSVREPTPGSTFTLGPMTGRDALGTDLSDDHPVSFLYDTSLAAIQGELADPATLPPEVPLDENNELQCDTCHDPHEPVNPDFLRVSNQNGALCTDCHDIGTWPGSDHAASSATFSGSGTSPWPSGAWPTVAENACLNCHRSHSAGHGEWLLAHSDEPGNCTDCHDGAVAQKDIATEFTRPFRHPIDTSQWVHQPHEDPLSMPRHVACDDCHNPHAAASSPSGTAQTVSGSQNHVSGVDINGTTIDTAVFKYEVCLKCHGEQEPATPGPARADGTRNIRLRIDPANPSYHPLAAAGTNAGITGLVPPLTPSSQVDCTDCHESHGADYAPILALQYQTEDPVMESYPSYALCYSCHDRTTLLTPPAGSGFPHDTHVVADQASCAVCHDAHGSRNNAFLIDFMTRTQGGTDVVTPSSGGLLEFTPAGAGHGSCSLSCHGHDHSGSSY